MSCCVFWSLAASPDGWHLGYHKVTVPCHHLPGWPPQCLVGRARILSGREGPLFQPGQAPLVLWGGWSRDWAQACALNTQWAWPIFAEEQEHRAGPCNAVASALSAGGMGTSSLDTLEGCWWPVCGGNQGSGDPSKDPRKGQLGATLVPHGAHTVKDYQDQNSGMAKLCESGVQDMVYRVWGQHGALGRGSSYPKDSTELSLPGLPVV